MSKFTKFSIDNSNRHLSYSLNLKSILITIGCYFLNPIIAVLIFIVSLSKKNIFVSYHAFHSIVISFLLSLILYMFLFFNIFSNTYILKVTFNILSNIFAIYGSYYFLNNKNYNVPFISTIFKKIIK